VAVDIQNTFDGIANATVLTSASAAATGGTSGNAASSINVGAGSTITAKTTSADHGARRLEFNLAGNTADGATRIFWATSSPTTDRLVFSLYVNLSATVTTFEDLGGITNSGGTKILTASIRSDGHLQLFDATGAAIAASVAPNIFPTGWVRVDLAVQPGGTTTTGYLGYQYYVNNNASAVYEWHSSAVNAGTTAVAQCFIGRTTGRAGARIIQYDTVRAQAPITGTATYLAPYVDTGGTSGSVTQVGINTAEGIALGTNLTSSDAGLTGGASGMAANGISIGAASSITVSDFNVVHGSRGYAFSLGASGSGDSGATRILWNFTRSDRAVLSFYIGTIADPITAVEDLGGFRNSTGNMAYLRVGTDGKAFLTDITGTITGSKSTNVIPVDTQIRFDIAVRKGTTTTDGLLGYAYYLNDSSTPTFQWEESTHNTGTTDVAQVFIGRTTALTQAHHNYYDTVRWGFSGTTGGVYFAPYVPPPQVPTGNIGSTLNDLEPFSVVTIDATASLPGSKPITSYSLTQTAGPTVAVTGSGPLWTYPAPATIAGTAVSWSMTCTNGDGLTSAPVSVTHNMLAWDIFAVGVGTLDPMQVLYVTS
jgi:hypothetical protein